MQEFFELKLGNMTMDEYDRKFLELLRYVGFIKNDKVKIQRFLSKLPYFYMEKINFDIPRWHNLQAKDQDHQSIVGDVKERICIEISIIKKKK
jgi:hypothetical protein